MTDIDDFKMDNGTVTAILGCVGIIAAALVTGFWQWMAGRRKADIEAQASVMNGFVLLLSEFKNERVQLVARINELESNNNKQDRHIAKLERLIISNSLPLPNGDRG